MFRRKLTCYTLTFFALLCSQTIIAAPGDMLSSFTISNTSGDGLTPTTPQGIAYHNGYLYIVDFGTDRIYRTLPEDVFAADGVTITHAAGESNFNIPIIDNGTTGPTGGGLTFASNFLWNASPVTDDIIKIDPIDGDTLEAENTLSTALVPSPSGIAFDGTYFWIIDWRTNTINKVLPEDGTVLSTIPGPSNLPSAANGNSVTNAKPFGIVWDGAALWVSDHHEDRIYRINPDNGAILTSFSTSAFTIPSEDPKGLAWDGEFLWLTDQSSQTIYKIETGVIPIGILGCIEKNGVPIAADVLLSQTSVSDQIRALDSDGCFLFDNFESGVEVNLSFSESGVDEKPTISLAQVNGSTDIFIELNDTYIEALGTTAIDPEDGDISAQISASPDTINNALLIDTSVVNAIGIPITYDVVDSAGNTADTKTRLIFITPVAYSISANVSGLKAGESLTITNNSADSVALSSDTAFTFPTEIAEGLSYNVHVSSQPTGQICLVSNGAGTALADVSNVLIACSDITYNINVNATGLDVGDTLVMSNNGLTRNLTANGVQEIDTTAYNAVYDVHIDTPPNNKSCFIGNHSPATSGNAHSHMTVDVECQFINYSLGGTLTGLDAGDTPKLRVEFNNQLTTLSADGPYTLTNTINSGSAYSVTLNKTPNNKTCTITGISGTATADVLDINIDCVDNTPAAPTAPTINLLTINNQSPTLTGTASVETGDTLTVIVGSATYDYVTVTSGIWNLDTATATPTSGTFNPLSDGYHDIIATLINVVGNSSSDSSSDELQIDTAAPSVPTVNSLFTSIIPPNPISGTATINLGESLSVTVNGATYSHLPVTAGNWSLNLASAAPTSGALASFVDGNSYEVIATITDSAGNTQADTSYNELTMVSTVSITLTVTGYSSASALEVSELISGAAPLSITANGTTALTTLSYNANYTFSITSQPTGQACQIPASLDAPKTTISGSATVDISVTISCNNITAIYNDAPALTITSNGKKNRLITETATINITDDRQIADLNVYLDMSHTFPGDTSFSLTSPSGTTVMLLERPGTTEVYTTTNENISDSGCGGDNVNVTLDDEGTAPAEDACNPLSGTLIPNNPLSAFDGESSLGIWTLTVYDSFSSTDDGTLNNWSLEVIIPTL